jgi:hypothetical protein
MIVNIIFNGGHNIVGNGVEFFTHSQWAHVSFVTDNALYEAVEPKFHKIDNIHIYDEIDHEILKIEVPNIEAALKKAEDLIGTPYGLWTDCIATILDDIGVNSETNGEITVHCSESVTRILRAGGLDILGTKPADKISPEDLYQELIKIKIE